MGKYSNVLLTDAHHEIVTAAHQVNEQQSSVRTIRTGGQYRPPPAIMGTLPRLDEPFGDWHDRISLVPGQLSTMMVKSYSGLSTALAKHLIWAAELDPTQATDGLTTDHWQQLYVQWQRWLQCLEKNDFQPGWGEAGYTVLGWAAAVPTTTTPPSAVRCLPTKLSSPSPPRPPTSPSPTPKYSNIS